MTVSYQYAVTSSTSGGFTRLLFLWRGSLYKLIYRELLFFLVLFVLLGTLYRHVFNPEQKRFFEDVVVYCDSFLQLIPLSFILGFYVKHVADRWWQQYMALPYPDKMMHTLAMYVGSNDEESRILRRSLIRYLNLSMILILRSISSSVKRRFPTLDHVVESGFMTKTEQELYMAVPNAQLNPYWVPCSWFISHLKDAADKKIVSDPNGLKLIMEEFNEFRSKCGLLRSYDWISIPLVYTQVVTLATYSFFIAALVGRQYVDHPKKELQMELDAFLPIFTILEFLFYMGLLKVAEQLINPFGDDDEDFELNWLIDRHAKVSYLGVDFLMDKTPPLVKDKYFNDIHVVLPYTGAAVQFKKRTHRGSTYKMKIPKSQQTMFLPQVQEEELEASQSEDSKTSNHKITKSNGPGDLWRQKGDAIDIEQASEPSFIVQQASNPKNYFRRTGSHRPSSSRKKSFQVLQMHQWQHRSFNSTVESYGSTKNIISDSSLEMTPDIEKKIDDSSRDSGKEKSKKGRLSRQSSANVSTEHLMSDLGISRGLNFSSSQWKGVTWSPVSPDSCGTGDIPARKRYADHRMEFEGKRRGTDPLSKRRGKTTRHEYKINNSVSSPFSTSLPNLYSSNCSSGATTLAFNGGKVKDND